MPKMATLTKNLFDGKCKQYVMLTNTLFLILA
jgi:hypothetical protein